MSASPIVTEIEYPDSDGQPLGETDIHIDWILRLRALLKQRYQGERVYVGSDLLVYYVEGQPWRYCVPDGFVVLDCDPGRRRTFKIWEEKRTPDVVFEFTSRSSKIEDTVHKPRIYAQIGVREYFAYDPTSDYLMPALQGWRLQDGVYVRIENDASGNLTCETLGLFLRLDQGQLAIADCSTQETLRTPEEIQTALAAARGAEAERNAAEAERYAAEAQRNAAELEFERAERRRVEAENRAIKEELDRLRRQQGSNN